MSSDAPHGSSAIPCIENVHAPDGTRKEYSRRSSAKKNVLSTSAAGGRWWIATSLSAEQWVIWADAWSPVECASDVQCRDSPIGSLLSTNAHPDRVCRQCCRNLLASLLALCVDSLRVSGIESFAGRTTCRVD